MTCILVGGALIHFADEPVPGHHATYQARCEDCGRFLRWAESSAWWECSLHGLAPR